MRTRVRAYLAALLLFGLPLGAYVAAANWSADRITQRDHNTEANYSPGCGYSSESCEMNP